MAPGRRFLSPHHWAEESMISARGRWPRQAHSAAKSVHYVTEGLGIDPHRGMRETAPVGTLGPPTLGGFLRPLVLSRVSSRPEEQITIADRFRSY
jgi:hypothetical protein